jgi:hypothetical protein
MTPGETIERFARIKAELEQAQEDSRAALKSILQKLDFCIEVLGAHEVTVELTPILAKLGFSLRYTGVEFDEVADAINDIIHRADVAQGEATRVVFGQRVKQDIASKLGVTVEDVDTTLAEQIEFDNHAIRERRPPTCRHQQSPSKPSHAMVRKSPQVLAVAVS